MKYIFFASLLLCLPFLSSVKAQDSTRSFTLAMRPFHALVGGYRVDAEHRIAKSNQWIQVGGELFFNRISRYSEEYSSRRQRSSDYIGQGYGISIFYKFYLNPRRNSDRFYFITGPTFESLRYNYEGLVWEKFEEDGLIKYHQQLRPSEDQIKSFSYTTAIGFQQYVFKYIFVDLYVGLGVKKAVFKSDIPYKENPFDRYLWDSGRTGTFPIIAARVGVLLF